MSDRSASERLAEGLRLLISTDGAAIEGAFSLMRAPEIRVLEQWDEDKWREALDELLGWGEQCAIEQIWIRQGDAIAAYLQEQAKKEAA